MRRYLVVANRTLGGDHLVATIRECMAAGPCAFHVLVPATPPADGWTWTEAQAQAIAQKRLDRALASFRALGAEVEGHVGDPNPMLAVMDALRERPFDEIIVSTLPPKISRWLKQDLPHRVERASGLPVRHVMGEPEPGVAAAS